jgi:hypothetical protein
LHAGPPFGNGCRWIEPDLHQLARGAVGEDAGPEAVVRLLDDSALQVVERRRSDRRRATRASAELGTCTCSRIATTTKLPAGP